MEYLLKTKELNFYLCSMTIGLLRFILRTERLDLGIWTLGLPKFRGNLDENDVDQRLLKIIQEIDELDAMNELGIDVKKYLKDQIDSLMIIMNDFAVEDRILEIEL